MEQADLARFRDALIHLRNDNLRAAASTSAAIDILNDIILNLAPEDDDTSSVPDVVPEDEAAPTCKWFDAICATPESKRRVPGPTEPNPMCYVFQNQINDGSYWSPGAPKDLGLFCQAMMEMARPGKFKGHKLVHPISPQRTAQLVRMARRVAAKVGVDPQFQDLAWLDEHEGRILEVLRCESSTDPDYLGGLATRRDAADAVRALYLNWIWRDDERWDTYDNEHTRIRDEALKQGRKPTSREQTHTPTDEEVQKSIEPANLSELDARPVQGPLRALDIHWGAQFVAALKFHQWMPKRSGNLSNVLVFPKGTKESYTTKDCFKLPDGTGKRVLHTVYIRGDDRVPARVIFRHCAHNNPEYPDVKEGEVPMEVNDAVERWLKESESVSTSLKRQELYLFIDKHGKPATPRTFMDIFKRGFAFTGKQVCPQLLRKKYAQGQAEALREVQDGADRLDHTTAMHSSYYIQQ